MSHPDAIAEESAVRKSHKMRDSSLAAQNDICACLALFRYVRRKDFSPEFIPSKVEGARNDNCDIVCQGPRRYNCGIRPKLNSGPKPLAQGL